MAIVTKILLPAFFVVAIILGVIIFSMDEAMPIGIIDDVTFGEGPEELFAKLGSPHTIVDKREDFSEVEYEFLTNLSGEKASIWFSFLDDKSLLAVYVTIECESKKRADEVFEEWRHRLQETYDGYRGFYFNEVVTDETGHLTAEMGTIDGAYGLYCTVLENECEVKINVTYMR